MPEREKVIEALRICRENLSTKSCRKCPYMRGRDGTGTCYPMDAKENNVSLCWEDLIDDAIALLKEQEPRVIELSEITPHVYVWVEDRNEKTLFPLKGGMVDPDGDDYFRFVENVDENYIYWPMVAYGKWWRVWNLMPSPDQMRDTKWEGENETM